MNEPQKPSLIPAVDPFGALASDVEGMLAGGDEPAVTDTPAAREPVVPETRVIEAQSRSAIRALIITSDDVITEGSIAQREAIARSALFEELHIIVFTDVQHPFVTLKIAPNAWVHPTNSTVWWRAPLDAHRIVRRELYFAGSFRADVIASDDPFLLGLTAAALAYWYERPLHVTASVDSEDEAFERKDPHNSYWKLVARFVFSRAAQVRALSEPIAASIRARYEHLEGAVDMIPRVLDIHAEVPASVDLHKKFPNFQYIMVLAGTFDTSESIAFAMSASQHALKQYQSVGLVIAGNGEGMTAIQPQIEARGIAGKVFTVAADDDALVGIVKTADTLLAFSSNTSEAIMSAAAVAGTPIIATTGGASDALIENEVSGLTFAPGDLGTAIKSINKYMGDSGYRKLMASRAKERIQRSADDVLIYNEKYRQSLEHAILGAVVHEEGAEQPAIDTEPNAAPSS